MLGYTHPPQQTHPLEQTPPGTDAPGSSPPEQTHPPRADMPPPGADTPPVSMLGDTVNVRAVRILLEGNLVSYCARPGPCAGSSTVRTQCN